MFRLNLKFLIRKDKRALKINYKVINCNINNKLKNNLLFFPKNVCAFYCFYC